MKTKKQQNNKRKSNKDNKTQKLRKKNKKDKYANTELYPLTKPLSEHYMKVSNLHTIYVSTYGNKNGKPVIYVHGGPGAGTNQHMPRFFNPKKYYIVLVDQRGCGKSRPSAELRENDTTHLINDFEKVRKFLNIKKWMVYGGSWGSTLSLAYAMKHPKKTTELVLRGIYFCTDDEIHWISEPKGAQYFNPEAWEYYKNMLPKKNKNKLYIEEYQKCFQGKYGKQNKDKCMLAWGVLEDSISSLNPTPLKKLIKDTKKDNVYSKMSPIENHYFLNNCFFKPNHFLNPSNLNKIKNIPTTIVQGLYDLECPFITAYKLHKLLPKSIFYPTVAGHTAMDKENIKYLVKATDSYVS